jgi:hypothetical protein
MSESPQVIRISRSGSSCSNSAEDIHWLTKNFKRDSYIRFPGLLSDELLRELYSQILRCEWEQRVHEEIGVELCLKDKGIDGILNFLFNDRGLFQLLQQITGCETIGSFSGRVYRMTPGSGHYDSWHGDVGEHRLLALSLNLGRDSYQGGVLRLRQRNSDQPEMSVPNTGFGDAIIFRIAPDLEHKVSSLKGDIPKTAFAGWFRSEPDFWSTLVHSDSLRGDETDSETL